MKRRPNIIVVLLDTLRADHLSSYGHGRDTSPAINRLAEEGVLFEQAVSPAAWTPPSHASLFTGTFPSRHKVDRSNLVLPQELHPLPQVLQRHGYRTYGVSSNYWLSRETSFDRGFDRFVHSWQVVQAGGTNAPLARQDRKHALDLQRLEQAAEEGGFSRWYGGLVNSFYEKATQKLRKKWNLWDDGAWRVNWQVRQWLNEWSSSEAPVFAFLHYMEPHIRYAAPGRYRHLHLPKGVTGAQAERVNQDPWKFLTGRTEMTEDDFDVLSRLYDGEISYVDTRVGQLVDMLKAAHLLDDTLLVVTSDHGENLGDHGFMDHCYCLYDSLLHVPLIARGPEGFSGGKRVSGQVQSNEIFATALDLAGVPDEDPARSQIQTEGTLFPETAGGPEHAAFAEYGEPQPPLEVLRRRFPDFEGRNFDRSLRMVRQQGWKYIQATDGSEELYDLAADPGETQNQVETETARADGLKAQLEARFGPMEAAASQEGLDLDADTLKKLEQMGYLA